MNNYESNDPTLDQSSPNSSSRNKIQEYGTKSLGPFVDILTKYEDLVTPYVDALVQGLQGGAESLRRENQNQAEKYVSNFFSQASSNLKEMKEKLQEKDVRSIQDTLSSLSNEKPSFLFATSYLAGVFFGRLGKHLASGSSPVKNPTPVQSGPSDQLIH